MKNIKFQYYNANVKDTHFKGWVSLESFIRSIKYPKPKFSEIFKAIAKCEENNEMEQKAKLKRSLYYFTPCVKVKDKRTYNQIYDFTGLLVLDFDHIESVEEFKQALFEEYKFVICAWISPSKKGVKALVNIPIVETIEEFKSYFYGIADVMEAYEGFDGSGQNCVLPLFQSVDPEILYRDDYEQWQQKGFKRNELPDIKIEATPILASDRYEKIMIGLIEKGIDKINTNGHPQLRGLCMSVGGYVANNYITEYKAISLIDHKIATNSYLKKGVKGYQKTARWAINLGMRNPLHLNIDK